MEVKNIRPNTFKNNLHSLVRGKNRLISLQNGKVLRYFLVSIQKSVK
jgi:hypothetical protein